MKDNDDDVVVINGRRYPSRYAPGSGSDMLDKAWAIVDGMRDGILTDTERSFLAGEIVGTMIWARKHTEIQ